MDTDSLGRPTFYPNGVFCRVFGESEKDHRPPLVLLHGLGNSSSFWVEVARRLARERRVFAFDTPGFGRSRATVGKWSVTDLTAPIAEAIRMEGIDDYEIGAHSFGGLMALELARIERDHVRRLFFVNAHLLEADRLLQAPWRMVRHPIVAAALLAQIFGGLFPSIPSSARFISRSRLFRRVLLRPFMATPVTASPSVIEEALLGNRGGLSVFRALRAARSLTIEDAAMHVATPVVLIYGTKDLLLTPQDQQHVARLLTVTHSDPLDGAGHWPLIERPDEVAEGMSE